ncbi:MAG TPA: glycosyltransferase family 1 protein [Puia sp.]|nr:glycosyltransferase family 1 protein [Puia sp.]
MEVVHLFRKKGAFFSIERVFARLEPELNKFVTVRRVVAPSGGSSLPAIVRNLRVARRVRADIYHVTGDLHYLTLGLPRKRTILTIHDCVFLYQTKGVKRLLLKWLFLSWPVRHCALVTTISESTRQDIIRHTGCAPGKVVVIPNPVDSKISFSSRPFHGEEPVFLFLGSTPNKNLLRTIPALEGIPCLLDVVGDISTEAIAQLQRHKIRYRQASNLTDEEVAEKYCGADVVLFPSTFEGFGLPVIEAQQAGRPVVTSDLDPMREVAGAAACLVDPYAVEAIREGILRVVHDREYREELVRKGFENVKRFATAAIVHQYVSCYQGLLPLDRVSTPDK